MKKPKVTKSPIRTLERTGWDGGFMLGAFAPSGLGEEKSDSLRSSDRLESCRSNKIKQRHGNSEREKRLTALEKDFLAEIIFSLKKSKANRVSQLKDKFNIILLAHFNHGYLTKTEELKND